MVEDWENDGEPTELRFEGKGTPKEQADAAFAKARRLRRGSAVLEDLLAQCAAAEQRVAAWTARLDEGEDADALRAEIVPGWDRTQERDVPRRRLQCEWNLLCDLSARPPQQFGR